VQVNEKLDNNLLTVFGNKIVNILSVRHSNIISTVTVKNLDLVSPYRTEIVGKLGRNAVCGVDIHRRQNTVKTILKEELRAKPTK